ELFAIGGAARPARSRWTSFTADPTESRPRMLSEEGNPDHRLRVEHAPAARPPAPRLRVEHDRATLLVHLSDEDGAGWTVMAVDRATRRWSVAQARPQIHAAQDAIPPLLPGGLPPHHRRE